MTPYAAMFLLYVESQACAATGIRRKQAAHQSDAGCLAAPIRAEESVYFSSFNFEGNIIDNFFRAERFAQIMHVDGKRIHGRLTLTG